MSSERSSHVRRRRGTGSITSRGRGRWELRIPLPPDPATARRRQHSVTVSGSRRVAEAELRRLADQVLPPPGSRPATTLRMAQLLEVWWESKRSTLAESTAREYERIIDARLKPDLGDKHLDRLAPFHLDAYYDQLRREAPPVSRTGAV